MSDWICVCNSPTCERSSVCRSIGELIITNKWIEGLSKEPTSCTTVPELLTAIDAEMEILCK